MPAMQPKMNGIQPPEPGVSYFSCSQPKRIIDAFTPKMASSAAASEIPQICAMRTIITDELIEYSTQRK
ncbi:unannotated protein [freshwater metagenome]|uniref:Unannotated protein n=1 Tax=freshwater metagenome TaxID=449393 RepID=A0A6J7RBK0_9ZZZZ